MAITLVFVVLAFVVVKVLSQKLIERRRKIVMLHHIRQGRVERLFRRNQTLQREIQLRDGELAKIAGSLIKQSEVIQQIERKLWHLKNKVKDEGSTADINRMLVTLREHSCNQADFDGLERNSNNAHSGFFKKLKTDFPDLSNSDLKLASYLRMNLSSKEIAELLNVSSRTLDNKRYMLRKKLKVAPGSNLIEFIIVNY